MSKLESMLRYVSEHNDFYKKRIKEYSIKDPLDITQWPVLTRKELQENRYNMFSDEFTKEFYKGNMVRKTSSGSSGIPVNVYWSHNNLYASNLSLWRKRLKWYGIKPLDRYVVFSLNAYNHNIKSKCSHIYKIEGNILLINITTARNEDYYVNIAKVIKEFNPVWLYIQPSILHRLIYVYKNTSISPPTNLKYIEIIGELLSSELKRLARSFFNVNIANMYGSEEMNGIAFECPHHHMNILDDNVYLEIENDTGIHSCGTGETIITNLNCYGMPLIRYNQGDMISITNEDICPCSDLNINIMYGRVHSSIQINDKLTLNSFFLMELISEVNNQLNDIILEYHFTYSPAAKELICYIMVDNFRKTWKESVINIIIETFYNKVDKREISFCVKDDIKEYKNKKRKILEII